MEGTCQEILFFIFASCHPLIVHCNGLSCMCVLAVSIVALAVLVFFRMSFSSSNSCSALSLLSMCFCSTNRPILVVLFSMGLAVQ